MNNEKELIFEVTKGRAQFAYFLLGIAASAIAFAIHETTGKSLWTTPWPMGVGVILWAGSFAAGCAGEAARLDGMTENARYLQARRGVPAHWLASVEGKKITEEAEKSVRDALNRPFRRFDWQLWSLFAGAVFYLAGHIMTMAAVPAMQVGIK